MAHLLTAEHATKFFSDTPLGVHRKSPWNSPRGSHQLYRCPGALAVPWWCPGGALLQPAEAPGMPRSAAQCLVDPPSCSGLTGLVTGDQGGFSDQPWEKVFRCTQYSTLLDVEKQRILHADCHGSENHTPALEKCGTSTKRQRNLETHGQIMSN